MQIKKQKGKMPELISQEPNILSPEDLMINYGISIATQNRLRLKKRQKKRSVSASFHKNRKENYLPEKPNWRMVL